MNSEVKTTPVGERSYANVPRTPPKPIKRRRSMVAQPTPTEAMRFAIASNAARGLPVPVVVPDHREKKRTLRARMRAHLANIQEASEALRSEADHLRSHMQLFFDLEDEEEA